MEVPRVLVLYGSETGTAQDVAEHIQQLAWNRHLLDAQSCALDEFPVAQLLPKCSIVIFVVATTGDGDAPDNMRMAWRALLRKNLPTNWLKDVQVAVFGLGDSSYAKYNAVARRLQARLVQLGATEIVERGLGDDQHALGFFGALNPWLERLWTAVLQRYPLPAGFVVNDSPKAIEPKYKLTLEAAGSDAVRLASEFDPRSDKSTFYAPPSTAIHKDTGLRMAKVVENRRLTAADWSQDVRHLVLDLGTTPVAYSAGAIAVVYPENTTGINELLEYVDLPGDTVVSITAADGLDQDDFPSPTSLKDLFSKYLDIQGTPRRTFFARLSLFATNEEEKEKLEEIASPEGADLLYDYCIREKKTYVEVLLDFPSVKVPLDLLVQFIPRLKPRSYSISSSTLQHPGQVHLTVAIVDFLTPYKRRRCGVCSAYFQSLDPTKEDHFLPIWIKTGLFSVPDPTESMLLIGPGTGLAAMRAIAQERHVLKQQASGTDLGSTSLYFGSRHQAKDFLYGDELTAMVANGALSELHTAFSRDQSHKIYVQTRLAEQKERIFELLMNGTYVYIAGSAKRMPSDIYEVLRDILRSVGKMSLQDAEKIMKTLVRTKRYVVESWS
ncbi:hypothetical protein Poli38472_003265 [Pythium oligandrum]|uniref:NADPH-dependent FMN and FAD-containing oxidoreductase n=1 Tax=Pythium oligandrum TaxID=41045 RepID=A0A8K1C6H9_PYTOL|nr:hypothetical protein Poli38472_003265 [Pythium oligandrum]|eukprot:TMW57340.1 hypothetical protein Poli38472_003265 [Pythium oligandrum]